ncbi:MAG: D-alanine-D-alanine ligase [Candidatus Latescibacterota bacterium]|jgi:D-alanine-D-alanine ligase
MSDKIRVGVLFGGRSAEHEVSVVSARSMLAAVDLDKYELVMVGIDREGRWLTTDDTQQLLASSHIEAKGLLPVALDYLGGRDLVAQGREGERQPLDVIFPLLHGPYGEDGTVQGLMELADVAYVGAGVLGSAVGMDKEMMKRAFRAEDLPQLDYQVVRRSRWEREDDAVLDELLARFELPVFVKPVNMGSSVGVSRAVDREGLRAGIEMAAEYDYKVVIEAEAKGFREVEVAILGNEDPRASVVGEIDPGNEFYDYGAKYVDDNSALYIPARISEAAAEKVREMAVCAFRAVEACGLSRVDFFVGKEDEKIYINEINTMPGFTPVSMYPKLWEASGLPYGALIDRLIELARQRHEDKKKTRTSL